LTAQFGKRLRGSKIGRCSPARVATDYPLQFFFAVAFAISWTLFLPMVLAGAIKPPLIVAASFGPTVAAIVTHRLSSGSYRAFRLFARWPRVVAGTIIGCVLVIIGYVVLPAIVVADPRELHWSVLGSPAVFNASTLLGGPLGEEPGWRGYAIPRLQDRFGPVRASLLIGVVWAGWHLPLFLIPGWSSAPIWTYVLIVTGVSVILTFSVNVAGFSALAAIASHAAFNTVSRWLAGLLAGVEPRVHTSMVTLLALCGLGVALLVTALTKGQLGRMMWPCQTPNPDKENSVDARR
jgi:membrane protease YdiL (CAAX protease family)